MGEVLLYFRKCLPGWFEIQSSGSGCSCTRPVQNSNKQNRADTLFEFVTDNETFRILGQHTIGKNLLRNIKKRKTFAAIQHTYFHKIQLNEWKTRVFYSLLKSRATPSRVPLFKTSQHYIQSFLPVFFFLCKTHPSTPCPRKN